MHTAAPRSRKGPEARASPSALGSVSTFARRLLPRRHRFVPRLRVISRSFCRTHACGKRSPILSRDASLSQPILPFVLNPAERPRSRPTLRRETAALLPKPRGTTPGDTFQVYARGDGIINAIPSGEGGGLVVAFARERNHRKLV